MCLSHVFSPIVACLIYHSLDIFFCGAEVFNFNGVCFINYFFHELCIFFHLKVILKVIYFFFYVINLGVFQAQHFAFRFVIHFEWIFVKGLRSVYIHFLNIDCLLAPELFVEETIFTSLYCLCSFIKDVFYILGICFWALYYVPLIYFSVLSLIPDCLDYHSITVKS